MTVTLAATTDCDDDGAICTSEGVMLSEEVKLTVPLQNSAATGAPAITGTAQVGQTLTAGTTGISDSDGLTNVDYSYQWLADGADISGASKHLHPGHADQRARPSR